jgi:hypothetical protein
VHFRSPLRIRCRHRQLCGLLCKCAPTARSCPTVCDRASYRAVALVAVHCAHHRTIVHIAVRMCHCHTIALTTVRPCERAQNCARRCANVFTIAPLCTLLRKCATAARPCSLLCDRASERTIVLFAAQLRPLSHECADCIVTVRAIERSRSPLRNRAPYDTSVQAAARRDRVAVTTAVRPCELSAVRVIARLRSPLCNPLLHT